MKKIISILLISICILSTLSGCCLPGIGGSLPTYNEAFAEIKDRFYDISTWTMINENYFVGPNKEEIVAVPGTSITYRNGIDINIIYYEEYTFDKITVYRSDISSAWDEVSYFYEDYSGFDLDLTATELENNMQQKTTMPNWTSYEYQHNGFSYTVTVGQNYVSITVEA